MPSTLKAYTIVSLSLSTIILSSHAYFSLFASMTKLVSVVGNGALLYVAPLSPRDTVLAGMANVVILVPTNAFIPISVKSLPKAIVVRLLQFSKAESPKTSMLLGRTNVINPVQPLKAPVEIIFKLLSKSNSASPIHPSKADDPIVWTLVSWRLIAESAEQPEKQLLPIEFKVAGKYISFNALQLTNALSVISVIPLPSTTVSSAEHLAN